MSSQQIVECRADGSLEIVLARSQAPGPAGCCVHVPDLTRGAGRSIRAVFFRRYSDARVAGRLRGVHQTAAPASLGRRHSPFPRSWCNGWRTGLPVDAQGARAVAHHGLVVLFLAFAVAIILRGVFEEKSIESDHVIGTVCGYLMAGVAWETHTNSSTCSFPTRSASRRSSPHKSARTTREVFCLTTSACVR